MDIKEKKEEDSSICSKKSKMRTASDVISRLLWDETLQQSDFIVGYLDRFKGIIEKPFAALDWSDPAIVDNNTLALPKHRIQYFKYKTKKVWDKNSRLDLIFGSTGDDKDIQAYMEHVDTLERYNFLEDDIEEQDEVSENEVGAGVEFDFSDRPNHFIAIRITEPLTVAKLEEVAEHIEQKDPTLAGCFIESEKYHLTLAALKLDSPEEVFDASMALSDLPMQSIQIPTMELSSVGIFQHRVVYACVTPNKELDELRQCIISLLEEWKVKLMDKEMFVPHVTIVKTSRPAARRRHSRFIDPGLFSGYLDEYLGDQIVDKIYLCEIGEVARDDGFYDCATEVSLG